MGRLVWVTRGMARVRLIKRVVIDQGPPGLQLKNLNRVLRTRELNLKEGETFPFFFFSTSCKRSRFFAGSTCKASL